MIRALRSARRRVAVALLGLAFAASCGDAPAPSAGAVRRIVSVLPAATEILFAIGAGDRVVGRSAWCDWPPAARDLPAVGDAVSLNAESVLGLGPDLVLVGSGAQAEALGPVAGVVRVERVSADSVAEVRETIGRIGGLVGRPAEAEALVAKIDDALANARRSAAGRAARTVLFVAQREPLIVAGRGSYVHELLTALGARNAASDLAGAWPTLSLETLVVLDPDLILDSDLTGEGGAGTAFWGRFARLRAVSGGGVRRVADPAVLRPGPRIPQALAGLGALLGEEGR